MEGRSPWRLPGRSPWGWRGGEVAAVERTLVSRLDRALRRLENLARRSPFEAAVGKGGAPEARRLICVLNPPAAPDAIAEAELRVGAPLPDDYKRFLRCSDGAVLFGETEADASSREGGAELLNTAALARQAEALAGEYQPWCTPDVLILATVGSDGDRLAFETARMNPFGGCAVLDARHGSRPDQWWVIARDFTSWLETVLRDSGCSGSFGRLWGRRSPGGQLQLPLSEADDDSAGELWPEDH